MKLTRLDKRYAGHEYFTHCVNFTRNEKAKFVEIREWCWLNFGPSCELEHYYIYAEPKVWCWEVSQYNTRIYFKTDREINWYTLKWN